MTHPINRKRQLAAPTEKFLFAATAAHLGLVLRESIYLDDFDVTSMYHRFDKAFDDSDNPAVDELKTLIRKANAILNP